MRGPTVCIPSGLVFRPVSARRVVPHGKRNLARLPLEGLALCSGFSFSCKTSNGDEKVDLFNCPFEFTAANAVSFSFRAERSEAWKSSAGNDVIARSRLRRRGNRPLGNNRRERKRGGCSRSADDLAQHDNRQAADPHVGPAALLRMTTKRTCGHAQHDAIDCHSERSETKRGNHPLCHCERNAADPHVGCAAHPPQDDVY